MFLNVTIPVFNEEAQLAESVARLRACLGREGMIDCELVIADNGSTDRTFEIARSLCRRFAEIRAVHLDAKGRGGALKRVWLESRADILCYMDVDLSTDLAALPALIEAAACGGYDLAVGSRLLPDSRTTRGWKRELISRGYARLIRAMLGTHFSDAQCGFKAIRREVAQSLLPLVKDNGWFFDTELLVLAERLGYRTMDVPVRWVDDRDSRVKIFRTAWEDLKGLRRLRRSLGNQKKVQPRIANDAAT